MDKENCSSYITVLTNSDVQMLIDHKSENKELNRDRRKCQIKMISIVYNYIFMCMHTY